MTFFANAQYFRRFGFAIKVTHYGASH